MRSVAEGAKARRCAGFTLIELMVGMAVGLLVVAGMLALYVAIVQGNRDTVRAAKLNQELRAAMDLMVSDIRRAGYSDDSFGGDAPNPFAAAPNDLRIVGGDCIQYSYGYIPGDGAAFSHLPAGAGNRFGFRVRKGVLQARTGSGGCESAGGWEALTDSNLVEVSALEFSTVGSHCLDLTSGARWAIVAPGLRIPACDAEAGPGVDCESSRLSPPLPCWPVHSGDLLHEIRQVTIRMTGRLRSDARFSKTVAGSVDLRNDRVIPAP